MSFVAELGIFVPVFVALIATIGGGLVYLWQKSIDRRSLDISEKRSAYLDFLEAHREVLMQASSFQSKDKFTPDFEVSLNRYRQALDLFNLVASPALLIEVLQADVAVTELILRIAEEKGTTEINDGMLRVASKRARLITEIRKELFSRHEAQADYSVAELLAETETHKIRLMRVFKKT